MKTLHYFNPGHENAVLNRLPSYTPPSNMMRLMRELASLPAWYARGEDAVLVGEDFDKSYHEYIQSLNIEVPNIHGYRDLMKGYKLLVDLWGIAPLALRYLESLSKSHSLQFILPKWDENFIYWNSRMFARDILEEIKLNISSFNSLVVPTFCSDIESVELLFNNRLTNLLVKSPYSSSGRGLLWLIGEKLGQSEKQILQGMLNKQGQVSVEPIYEKVLDFAMEFVSDGNGAVSFLGYSLFNTNNKGAYQGNVLVSQQEIEARLCKYIDICILNEVKLILDKLFSNLCGTAYRGCIGVDMMIYLEGNIHKLHPCVEINMRYNMGYLAIKLYENHIDTNSHGIYNVDFDNDGNMLKMHREMEKAYPLVMSDGGRVRSGYLSLCPVGEDTHYRAYIVVEEL